jgi:hypothetical protein
MNLRLVIFKAFKLRGWQLSADASDALENVLSRYCKLLSVVPSLILLTPENLMWKHL